MILTRYIFLALLRTLGLALVSAVLGVVGIQIFPLFMALLGGKLSLALFLEALPLFVPVVLYLAMPLLAGAVVGLTYAQMVADGHVALMLTAGRSRRWIAVPGLVVSALAAALCAIASFHLVPLSFSGFEDIRYIARNAADFRAIEAGRFTEVKPNLTVFIGRWTGDDAMSDVIIHDARDPSDRQTLVARTGALSSEENARHLVLTDGWAQERARRTGQTRMVGFETMRMKLDELLPRPDPAARGRGWYEWPTIDLLVPPRDHPDYVAMRDTWMVEGHKRALSPLLCLTYGLAAMAYVLTAGYFRNDRVIVAARLAAGMLVIHLGMFALLPFAARLAPLSLAVFYIAAIGGAVAAWLSLTLSDRRLSGAPRRSVHAILGRLSADAMRTSRR